MPFPLSRPLAGFALALLACTAHAGGAPDLLAEQLKDRYQAQAVRVDRDADGRAAGLFQLRGPLAIEAQTSLQGAQAGAAQDPSLALAERFFRDNLELLAIDGPEALALSERRGDRFGHQHLRFARLIDGLPVAGMEVLVHVSPEGRVTGINGHIVRPPQALLAHMAARGDAPLVTEAQALAKVAELRGVNVERLRLLSAQLSLAVAAPFIRWHLDLNPVDGLGRFSYWLDAETGELIEVVNTLRHPIPFQG